MADYYTILARALLGLGTDNAQAREGLYQRARTVFVAHLRKHDPQMSAPEIISERIAFEAAILRLEAEWQAPQKRSLKIEPMRNANNVPDIASLLRQSGDVWPAPNKLLIV
jgi:hypothetical protein